jgi:hypothetical protein
MNAGQGPVEWTLSKGPALPSRLPSRHAGFPPQEEDLIKAFREPRSLHGTTGRLSTDPGFLLLAAEGKSSRRWVHDSLRSSTVVDGHAVSTKKTVTSVVSFRVLREPTANVDVGLMCDQDPWRGE